MEAMTTESTPGTASTSARALARDHLTRAILASARAQLGTVGPAALSVRAVARDVGLASSAVYRYFASRDDLLTALLVACFDEQGEEVEAAEAAVRAVDPGDLSGRLVRRRPRVPRLGAGAPVGLRPALRLPRARLRGPGADRRPGHARDPGAHGAAGGRGGGATCRSRGRTRPPRGRRSTPRWPTCAASRGSTSRTTWCSPGWPPGPAWSAGVTLEIFGHLDNAVGDREAWFAALAGRLDPFATRGRWVGSRPCRCPRSSCSCVVASATNGCSSPGSLRWWCATRRRARGPLRPPVRQRAVGAAVRHRRAGRGGGHDRGPRGPRGAGRGGRSRNGWRSSPPTHRSPTPTATCASTSA